MSRASFRLVMTVGQRMHSGFRIFLKSFNLLFEGLRALVRIIEVLRWLRTINHLLPISVVMFMMLGCKKFVQIGSPTTQIATTTVFSNSASATSAQLAIYIPMWNESWNMALSCGLLSDELTNYSTNQPLIQYYTNSMSSIVTTGPWQNAYKYIYQANSIIEKLQNNGNIPASVAAQLIGESKFIRAFWHFYLTNLYGDVPLVLTTDYAVNASMPRIPQAQVYQQVVADLNDAFGTLNSNYVDITDTTISTDRVRPTRAAAAAMLARVYLYKQKYDSAELQANLVINNATLYNLCKNLTNAGGATNFVFQRNSTEAILQIATPIPSNYFTPDGNNFYLVSAPSQSTINCTAISPQLLNAFEPNDKRKVQWIKVYTTTGGSPVSYYFPFKYQTYNTTASTTSVNVTEYVMVLRLAEQYLIRAEARAQQGKLADAIADLNAIRNRAGLPNYSGGIDQSSVLAAILHERQVELFTEWGHRWIDLKRTANLDAVMGGPTGVCQAKHGTWSSDYQLFPVPQAERNNNANLTQNSGY